jgi:hypothetical protein
VPVKVETVLERLHVIESAENRSIIKDFDSFLKEIQGPSDRHRSSALQVTISLAVFLGVKKLHEIGKEDVITFLDSRNVGGEWVKRERDSDGKWISTWNYHLALCRTFFRWLHNRGKDRVGCFLVQLRGHHPGFPQQFERQPLHCYLHQHPLELSQVSQLSQLFRLIELNQAIWPR